ncbi:DNA topoisomerase [[Bacteroides] pectinophilus ATCC 43243]|uniref:DNA topoisomerase n=1 Tax=[Bacteroides] pectinophilus ATCC 43243 TaxID=483218 RepID=B7ATA4_9FIRM|nr:DNA topoisomerase [[Bacteroides] pectinophilus ATCC 43243]
MEDIMGKSVFIAEKPSVAQEFAKALHAQFSRKDGFLESEQYIVTWCYGHLVSMSYPEKYDEKLKRWSLDTLPFLPEKYRYEVIPSAQKQFETVKGLLNRADVSTIYICTDSGREGEYIYRLVDMMAGVKDKKRLRVWIDSQTEEEVLKGIKQAKDWSEYDNLSASAFLRAKEDYLMGINFSRALTLKYGRNISGYLRTDRTVVSVGRVMTCVLGMVVRREREIRSFEKTPFYRVIADITCGGQNGEDAAAGRSFPAEWRVTEKSRYYNTPDLYKENGFKKREKAAELIRNISGKEVAEGNAGVDNCGIISVIDSVEKKKETKNPPLLYNLAELQNDCSKLFKISPDQTLQIVQELYEKKLVTYPRTDARVLSTAVCKEIHKNIGGLRNYALARDFASEILEKKMYTGVAKTRYCDDKKITDHYAIIPTGQGFGALGSVSQTASKVYEVIVRRFLSIFYPAAQYQKISIVTTTQNESFFASFKVLVDEGYLKVTPYSFIKKKAESGNGASGDDSTENEKCDAAFFEELKKLRKGSQLPINSLTIKEGETTPPKRYTSGSMILAMENAGQLIEDEELRAQIKGSGIGTSATRAEILKKLDKNNYICINNKTQVITPAKLGEIIYEVVNASIPPLLNAELTASWEKGLTYVAEGTITSDEYMAKLEDFVSRRTNRVINLNNQAALVTYFNEVSKNYK